MLTACRSKTLVAKHSLSEVLKGLGRGYGEVEVAEMVQAEEMVDGEVNVVIEILRWSESVVLSQGSLKQNLRN
ncbi:hypothetical protein Tco_0597094 [Tanacetum coccineum]